MMRWLAIVLWVMCGACVIWYLKSCFSATGSVRSAIRESVSERRRAHISRWMWKTASPFAMGSVFAVLAVQVSGGYVQATASSLLRGTGIAVAFGVMTLPPLLIMLKIMARSPFDLYSIPTADMEERVTLYPRYRTLYVRVVLVFVLGLVVMALVDLLLLQAWPEGPRVVILGSLLLLALGLCAREYWRFLRQEVTITRESLRKALNGRSASAIEVRLVSAAQRTLWSDDVLRLLDPEGNVVMEFGVSASAESISALRTFLSQNAPHAIE